MYYVKHRAYQEVAWGSGVRPELHPWKYDGPFVTVEEARAHWDRMVVDWQEGGVVGKCDACGAYADLKPPQ